MASTATQRIIKIRRDYNAWVADETMEDYALRFTPRSFRKWSEFRVANTAIGAISFLALEAIGGSIALNYGFVNAFWAILVVGLVIFLTGIPISYYAARYGIDMDLLTRGAGFGYIGSTITSLIYASFTFIFFAIEAAIMALALELCFAIPLSVGYLLSSLVIIPLVTHGITLINRLQMWTQPVWLVLLALPYIFVMARDPHTFDGIFSFAGRSENGASFDLLLFGAAATVAFSLIAQIGEQVDFLRFLPEKTPDNRVRWWTAMLTAGPGWIVLGVAKLLGGALLAYLAIQHEIGLDKAVEPTQMYLVGFQEVFHSATAALAATAFFVILSQVKINVTNAYAGSLAWSNFFSRLTHIHPGRVVWLVFNVIIAILLMELGVFKALEHVLGLYSNVAIAWVGALVADLVVNKPLGLSPRHIEFKRAYLYDINPVGVGSMLIASVLSIAAYAGLFGNMAQSFAPFIALLTAFVTAPLIAAATRGKYYIARKETHQWPAVRTHHCTICENAFEVEDMAHCPAYGGTICSLCCSLDARCHDRCKDNATLSVQVSGALRRLLPAPLATHLHSRVSHFLVVFAVIAVMLAAILTLIYYQEGSLLEEVVASSPALMKVLFFKVYAALLLISAIGTWWLVLANESRLVAQEESNRQTHLLMREIDAHRQTDAMLQKAKESADAANLAKSRYVTGMSHELRTPLNSILGYAQILQKDASIPVHRRDAIDVIRRSGEHLLSLIDGLLDIARIEAGKLRLERGEVHLAEFLDQIARMFTPQAQDKGLRFQFETTSRIPRVVHADERRLRQILINLLGNAVKFTDYGQVSLRVSYLREIARIQVEDSGFGIAPEDLERIFLPFERSGMATRRGDVGTGLGLPISRMLATLMGGELTVQSTPGKGSLFELRIYLPEVISPKTTARTEVDIVGYRGPRKRLLILDDEPSQRALLTTMLGPLGFEITQAASGEECLRLAALLQPDAFLLDVTMPGIDGWEVCRLLRVQGFERTPVIMVSASAFENDPARRMHTRADDFIVKPVLVSELLAKLNTQLKLDWIHNGEQLDPQAIRRPQRADLDLPPVEQIDELLELGAIGYVKGIKQKLDEIDRLDPRYEPFTGELRTFVNRFRLAEYSDWIKEVTSHEPRNP